LAAGAAYHQLDSLELRGWLRRLRYFLKVLFLLQSVDDEPSAEELTHRALALHVT
jgi:hypothetical protein